MPVCGSGAVVSAWSLLIRRPQRACRQAETPLIVLCRFPGPVLLNCHRYSWREKCMLSLSESGVAMTILAPRHITPYQYKQPVSFGEHWMMLRPRESLDQRVLDSKLEISPKPTDLRWTQDVFGNHVAVARFVGRAQALCFESTVRLDHSPTDIVDMEIENFTRTYPFTYGAEDMPDLAPFVGRQSSDGTHELDQWV